MNNANSFERGLVLYSSLIAEESGLARELESSRMDFGPAPGDPVERESYDRRHL